MFTFVELFQHGRHHFVDSAEDLAARQSGRHFVVIRYVEQRFGYDGLAVICKGVVDFTLYVDVVVK